MASSTSHEESVEDLCANMSLDDEEDVLVLEDISDETAQVDFQWCLVGRFLTDRVINPTAMKNTLASIWRPVKGVCIKELSPTLFLFQFFHEIDMDRVVKGGPWTFNQHLLITSRVQVGDNPMQIPLFLSEFWIQVYDLPCGFMSEKVAKEIGKFIGVYIEADAKNFDGIWRNFMRIRVAIDVRKPLKKRMRIKKLGGEWAWINFKYERMPTFCFYCGIIGHNEKFCEKFFDCKDKQAAMEYGTWIRAPNRRDYSQIGERWLRNNAPTMVGAEQETTVTVEDMQLATVDPRLQAKGKKVKTPDKEGSDNMGEDNAILNVGREVSISFNSNSKVSDLGSKSQHEGVVILDTKRRRMIDLHENEVDNVVSMESIMEMSNQNESKNFEMAGLGFQACQDK